MLSLYNYLYYCYLYYIYRTLETEGLIFLSSFIFFCLALESPPLPKPTILYP